LLLTNALLFVFDTFNLQDSTLASSTILRVIIRLPT
jgi:hypothetical protein